MSSMEINKVLTQMRALSGSMGLPEPNLTGGVPAAGGNNFNQVLAQSISKVNEQQAVATNLITDFQTGAGTASVAVTPGSCFSAADTRFSSTSVTPRQADSTTARRCVG